MRRKSFISPCKEINTDELFKRVHLSPANYKPPHALPDHSLRVGRLSTALSSTTYTHSQLHPGNLPKNTVSSSTKHANSNYLRISQLLATHWDRNKTSDCEEQHIRPRILNMTTTHPNMNRSSSYHRNHGSKENYELRPFTTGDSNDEESLEGSIRPVTGALNVRIRMKTSVERIVKSTAMEEELPVASNKIYVPKLWKRLKTLKRRHRRNQTEALESVVVGIKAV